MNGFAQLNARIPYELYLKLLEHARKEGISVTKYVTALLEENLKMGKDETR